MKTQRIIFLAARILLALPLIVFGLNKFLGFAAMEPPAGEAAQLFLGTMFSSFLAKTVGAFEIIGGVLLLVPRTKLIGLLVLIPIVFSISAFHFAHDMPGNAIWLLPLITTIIVAYSERTFFRNLVTNPSL